MATKAETEVFLNFTDNYDLIWHKTSKATFLLNIL